MHISLTVATRLTLYSPHVDCSLVLYSQNVCHMLYSFLRVIPQLLHFMCRCFGTLCSILCADVSEHSVPFYVPMFRNTLFHFMCRCFGTLCSILCADVSEHSVPFSYVVWTRSFFWVNPRLRVHTTYEDGAECSETSPHKILAPENHPQERKQHSQRCGSLKSRIIRLTHIYMGDGKPYTTVVVTGNDYSKISIEISLFPCPSSLYT